MLPGMTTGSHNLSAHYKPVPLTEYRQCSRHPISLLQPWVMARAKPNWWGNMQSKVCSWVPELNTCSSKQMQSKELSKISHGRSSLSSRNSLQRSAGRKYSNRLASRIESWEDRSSREALLSILLKHICKDSFKGKNVYTNFRRQSGCPWCAAWDWYASAPKFCSTQWKYETRAYRFLCSKFSLNHSQYFLSFHLETALGQHKSY